jgi:hypothetical protein
MEAARPAEFFFPQYLDACVLMSNHFHLLLEVIDFPKVRIMQSSEICHQLAASC